MNDILFKLNKLVQDLTSTTKRLEKENILNEYINEQEVKQILHFIFNPYIVTGISNKKLNKVKNQVLVSIFDINQEYNYENPLDLLRYLKEHNTGRDEDLVIVERFAGHHREYQDLIYAIASKDLKLGVQATTLNKVYGDNFVPTFEVMLAQKYFDDPDKLLPDGTSFIITEKLDGVRCVLINEENNPQFFSRQGQIFLNLTQLEAEAKLLPTGYIYDGEMLLNKEGLESKDLYRETMKVVSADKEKLEVNFNVFDMLPIEDFKRGYYQKAAKDRKAIITNLFNTLSLTYIKEVKVLYSGDDKVNIDKLLNIVDSKYKLVHIISQRSKQMHEHDHYQMKENEYQNKRELGRALEEIEKGLIKVKNV